MQYAFDVQRVKGNRGINSSVYSRNFRPHSRPPANPYSALTAAVSFFVVLSCPARATATLPIFVPGGGGLWAGISQCRTAQLEDAQCWLLIHKVTMCLLP